MSLETWKEEFYPITASDAAKGSALAAVRHSIRKWEGLRPDVLRRHGVKVSEDELQDETRATFPITSQACALCVKYYKYPDCPQCPLAKARDGRPCDRAMDCEDYCHPYLVMLAKHDPEPMIAWLHKAQSECDE